MADKLYNYAFIDGQNLKLAIKRQGWSLDYVRLRRYLSDKHNVRRAFIFLGYLRHNEKMYNRLRTAGYKLIFKPTVPDQFGNIKGNVDSELILYAVLNLKKYYKAVVISGDGDFHCLIKHLSRVNKLKRLIIPDRYAFSKLLAAPHIENVPTSFMNYLKGNLTAE